MAKERMPMSEYFEARERDKERELSTATKALLGLSLTTYERRQLQFRIIEIDLELTELKTLWRAHDQYYKHYVL